MRSLLVTLAVALSLAPVAVARAQGTGGGASWIEQRTTPSPFIASLGVGFGRLDDHNISAGEDLIGASLSLTGGGRLTPRLALIGHVEMAITEDNEDENRHTVFNAGVRFFPARSAWLQAGLGGAWYHVQYPSGFALIDVYGVSGHVGAGVVVARAGHFAVGLQGRGAYALYDEGGITTFSLALDLSWY